MKLSFLIFITLITQTSPDPINLDKNGLAVQGYDVVAYFEGAPQEGNEKYQYTYEKATYYFANAEHLNLFKANPIKYIPQYGGYCSYAITYDPPKKIKIDPETFTIIDGKLFLFYNFWGTNTLKLWNENPVNHQKKANDNWKLLTQ